MLARVLRSLAAAPLLMIALIGATAAETNCTDPPAELGRFEAGSGAEAPATPFFVGESERTLADYRGKALVVNLWATWCAPCRREMPALQGVADDLGDEVAIVGVTDDVDHDKAAAAAADAGARYDLLADPTGSFQSAVEVPGLPATLFVDAEGRILERHLGALTEAEIRSKIEEHYGVAA